MTLRAWSGLRGRLLTYFLALSLIPAAVFGYIGSQQAEIALQATVQQSLTDALHVVQIELDHWLEARVADVQAMAESIDARQLRQPALAERLTRSLERYGFYDDYMIVGADGSVVYDSIPGAGSEDRTGALHQTVMESALAGQTTAGDLGRDAKDGKVRFYVGSPILDSRGRVAGALLVGVSASELSKVTLAVQFGQTGEMYLLDERGRFLTESRFVSEFRDQGKVQASTVLELEQDLARFGDLSGGGMRQGVYESYRGRPVVGVAMRLQERPWTLVAEQDQTEALAGAATVRQTLLIALGITALAVTALALAFSRQVSDPVLELAAVADRVARGDLSVTPESGGRRDEIGRLRSAFSDMLIQLRTLAHGVADTAYTVLANARNLRMASEQAANVAQEVGRAIGSVASGASRQSADIGESQRIIEELRRAIGQIAAGAQEQANSVQDMAVSVNSMAEDIDQVAASAQQLSNSATEMRETARAGAEVVDQAVSGIERVGQVVTAGATQIQELGRHSLQIGEILNVITDIAEQTNLLALNAAIEAARAGEHGRGFAVVADQVRKLAERSSGSAKEISQIIRQIQAGTERAVGAMQQGTVEVASNSKLAQDAGRALRAILHSVEETSSGIMQISAATERISQSAKTVVKAVDSVSAVTEESTAATQEMAAAADEVASAAQRVAEISQDNAAAAEEVSAAAQEMSSTTEQIAMAAAALDQLAQELSEQIGRFGLLAHEHEEDEEQEGLDPSPEA